MMQDENLSDKNQRPQTFADQAEAQSAQGRSNQREPMRSPRDFGGGSSELIEMHGLLRLTVPHLSDAKEDHAERDQKSVLVACDDGWNCQRHAGHNKRNGPLGMILDVLCFHRRRAPFAEITCRFHLSEDGGFTQEVVLPPGWKIVND